MCDSLALWELVPEEIEVVVSGRLNRLLDMEPARLRTGSFEDGAGECDPLSLWLPVDEAVFRRACGVLTASFSLSVASRDELEDKLGDFEVM